MRVLTDSDLIALWEAAQDQHHLDRALTTLRLAYPDLSWESLRAMSIAERDARLLEVRADVFGQHMDIQVRCPTCLEALRFDSSVEELTVLSRDLNSETDIHHEGHVYRVAIPTSQDLAAICPVGDTASAARRLAAQCLRSMDGAPPENVPWDDALVTAISDALAQHDRQSAIRFRLECPSCATEWSALFDIVNFLWVEIDWRVRQVLDDVLDIAKAFGWREADVLAMPPARRAHYLKRAVS